MTPIVGSDLAKWDLTTMFHDNSQWYFEFEQINQESTKYASFRGTLGSSAEALLTYLEFDDNFSKRFEKLDSYARLLRLQNIDDPDAPEMRSKLSHLLDQVSQLAAFDWAEKGAISEAQFLEFVEEIPVLKRWEAVINRSREEREHRLEDSQEALLVNAISVMSSNFNGYTTLIGHEIDFGHLKINDGLPIEITTSNFSTLYRSPDREVRKELQKSYFGALHRHHRSFANFLSSEIKKLCFLANTRKYSSSLEAALAPAGLTTEIFYGSLKIFKDNKNIWHKYFDLRCSMLGLEKMAPYDVRAPWKNRSVVVPYEQATQWIIESLKPLGDEYVKLATHALTDGCWVDRYPRKNKSEYDAAYNCFADHPHIVLNYRNEFKDASILAHELGHAMHFYYTNSSQPHSLSRPQIFTTEIIANFHQALLRNYILKHISDTEIHNLVIEEEMGVFQSYYLFMPVISEIELKIHEKVSNGGSIDSKYLNEITLESFSVAYGLSVIPNEYLGYLWMSSLELYNNFYAFQYLTGLAGGQRMLELMLNGDKEIVSKYLKLISLGKSIHQMDALKEFGIDFQDEKTILSGFHTISERIDLLKNNFN